MHYCMSLAERMSALDNRTKVFVRHKIEKIFYDFEFGSFMFPKASISKDHNHTVIIKCFNKMNLEGGYHQHLKIFQDSLKTAMNLAPISILHCHNHSIKSLLEKILNVLKIAVNLFPTLAIHMRS